MNDKYSKKDDFVGEWGVTKDGKVVICRKHTKIDKAPMLEIQEKTKEGYIKVTKIKYVSEENNVRTVDEVEAD